MALDSINQFESMFDETNGDRTSCDLFRHHRLLCHGDVIKWKHCPRYWPFVRGIHRSSVNSPLKGQWRGALMISWICAWINTWVNNREAGDWRRHCAHYDVIVMWTEISSKREAILVFSFGWLPADTVMTTMRMLVVTTEIQMITLWHHTSLNKRHSYSKGYAKWQACI